MDIYTMYLAVMVLITASIFDALRDAWMRSAGWWRRHLVKWVSFYVPLAFIMFMHTPWSLWLPIIVASWLAWRGSLYWIAGVRWESMWVRWAKEIIRKINDR